MLGLSSIPALVVLKNRDFRILWISRSIHEVPRRMEVLVLGYLILRLTDSPFMVGLIPVFLYAPRPFLTFFGGLFADRLDRQRILVIAYITYVGIATMFLVLLITGAIQPLYVFIAVILRGSAEALDDPSRRTAMFDLAGPERLANAMSLETITQTSGRIVGPLTGGLLIAWTGFTGAYTAMLALELIALLWMVRLRLPQRPPGGATHAQVWQSLREGIGHSLSKPDAIRRPLHVPDSKLAGLPYRVFHSSYRQRALIGWSCIGRDTWLCSKYRRVDRSPDHRHD